LKVLQKYFSNEDHRTELNRQNKTRNYVVNSFVSIVSWLRELKRHFYGDRVITIAWSRLNSHPYRTRCCVLG